MSLLFNKEGSVFDEYGMDDDGWTREDHENLAKYGVKKPTQADIDRKKQENERSKSNGVWL